MVRDFHTTGQPPELPPKAGGMWPYSWTDVGTPSQLGLMNRVAATMPPKYMRERLKRRLT